MNNERLQIRLINLMSSSSEEVLEEIIDILSYIPVQRHRFSKIFSTVLKSISSVEYEAELEEKDISGSQWWLQKYGVKIEESSQIYLVSIIMA